MSAITLIAGVCIVSAVAAVLWKYKTAEDSHADATIIGWKLKTNLTHFRWYSEMMLKQDFGKLNFEQLEYLHQANHACEQAIKNLRRILKDEGLEKTYKELQGILKKRKR